MSTTISYNLLNATHQKALSYMGAVRPNVRMIAIETLLAAQAAGRSIRVVWGYNPASKPEHSAGTALDFMVYNDRAAGDWISNYTWTNRARLGVRWIIWRQRIRSTSPGKSGAWQWMADRGNPTQNHMDHPHINYWVRDYKAPSGGTVPTNPTGPGNPSNAKGEKYKVTTSRLPLNGRSGPGSNYPVTMTAAKGYVLNIVETKNGWAKSTGGHWYSMAYLTKQGGATKPAPASGAGRYRVTTKTAPLNGRSGPGQGYRVTMTAAKGYVLDIVQVRNGWGRSTGGHWYSMQYLRKV